MTTSIYWFRNDLRLTDNRALTAACASSDRLLPVALISPEERQPTHWGFNRGSDLRRSFRDQALRGLAFAVERHGSQLLVIEATASQAIPALALSIGADQVFCEAIAAPEEIGDIAALRQSGLKVVDHWQSSLLDLAQLPFTAERMPGVFTAFRQAIEAKHPQVPPPIPTPKNLPPLPEQVPDCTWVAKQPAKPVDGALVPFDQSAFDGSEQAALSHVHRYFGSAAPRSYKTTRNSLLETEHSTKFSPWLASGALSPRTVYQQLKAHEAHFGANESTYWIWFELLWRDFFRFSSIQHGSRLFRARGLAHKPPTGHDVARFKAWCTGTTGHTLIDAGMRELSATGFLSNRMRQIVASYLLHELACDWRAGAAWFESRLIDYDVCSNQGNWLYLAGRGADPRQGRWFNPDKQAAMYDSDGSYRRKLALHAPEVAR